MSATSPDTSRRAFDRAALKTATAGDDVLAAELVALFRLHILPLARQLASSCSTEDRRAAAHRVKGAALAIGASELAGAAGAILAGEPAGDLAAALDRFEAALGRTGLA